MYQLIFRKRMIACIVLLFAADFRGDIPHFVVAGEADFVSLVKDESLSQWWGLKTVHYDKYMNLDTAALQKKMDESMADIKAHWRFENGELINDGKGAYLSTRKFYGDFELLLDYKTVAKADSGIYLRGIPQVQIWDTTRKGGKWKLGADKGSGGLWNNPKASQGKDPLVHADKPFGEWNAVRIIMVGERVSIWLNNQLVVDHARLDNYFDRKTPENLRKPIPAKGPIQLQTHGGEIRWRDIKLREIGTEEANQILAAGGPDKTMGTDYESIFNGKDLSGWLGATDNYEVVGDAIGCKKGKGGTLYTKAVYADFEASLEFKLPTGGNNGLAIRYPGQGNPAYTGMCELQVLDNSAPKYATLKTYQYHGSAYSMVAAHRGYLRPVGEWNYQRVTVKGAKITVQLNGTVILNTDLSQVEAGKKHKGKDLKEGHFGFAGHGTAVLFRKLYLKRL